jgi:Domain of unknown function (DUF397)
MTTDTTPWVKASRSGGNGGNCVELRRHDGRVEVRDTKDQGAGPILRFTDAEFAAFLHGATHGEFDHLLL